MQINSLTCLLIEASRPAPCFNVVLSCLTYLRYVSTICTAFYIGASLSIEALCCVYFP